MGGDARNEKATGPKPDRLEPDDKSGGWQGRTGGPLLPYSVEDGQLNYHSRSPPWPSLKQAIDLPTLFKDGQLKTWPSLKVAMKMAKAIFKKDRYIKYLI
jgi:hypothetical protein